MRNISTKGFTLIELLVVISIISLLSSVVLASLNGARSKGRFAQAVSTMHSIETAASLEYDDFSNYAPDSAPGSAPRFVPKYLTAWPTPPCSGWTYDWDNWGNPVRISLRRVDGAAIFYYCLDPNGNCSSGGGTDIKTTTNKSLTCSE